MSEHNRQKKKLEISCSQNKAKKMTGLSLIVLEGSLR